MNKIRISKVSLDDALVDGNPCLRGIIDPSSLSLLQIDKSYQREYLAPGNRRYIMDALSKQQRLPDLELGMRGQTWSFDEDTDDPRAVILGDPVYLIDGQQRRGSILEFLARFPRIDPRQGVIVHFGSTPAWERARFQVLNLHQTRVSTSLIVRNLREECPGIATVYGLTQTDRDFPLYDRVGWGQNLSIQHLISGTGYVTMVLMLHAHLGAGIGLQGIRQAASAFNKLEMAIGLAQIRNNVKVYWELFDDCWGVRELTKRGATWMKANFILSLTDIFNDHVDFWTGPKNARFFVPSEIRQRLKNFPVTDPEIRNLANSSGQARQTLAYNFITWIDKGRRNILHKRSVDELSISPLSAAAQKRWRKAKAA